jgi:hypothetical protein
MTDQTTRWMLGIPTIVYLKFVSSASKWQGQAGTVTFEFSRIQGQRMTFTRTW